MGVGRNPARRRLSMSLARRRLSMSLARRRLSMNPAHRRLSRTRPGQEKFPSRFAHRRPASPSRL